MFSADKKKETTLALVKPKQQLKKDKVAAADSKKLPVQWVKAGPDCFNLITRFLDNDSKAIAVLNRTGRFFYHNTNVILEKSTLKQLAHYVVVEPNEVKITAMLTSEPTLVNAVIKKVIDNSGRELIDNTILQLAYGAGDPEMCLAIKPFFEKVYGSEKAAIEEMEKQRKQKFAENKEADEKQDKQAKDHMQHLLAPVIAAITAEQFNLGKDANEKLVLSPATLAAIETFRAEFDKSQPKRIEKGMHFRNNTLLETYKAYEQAALQWHYNSKKCALFEDGVLSCVLLYAPANDAQRFSQGMKNLYDVIFTSSFWRTHTLLRGEQNFYLVVRSKSSDFSFSGCAVDIYWGQRGDTIWGRARMHIREPMPTAIRVIIKLMSHKNTLFAELMRPVARRPKSQCVIC